MKQSFRRAGIAIAVSGLLLAGGVGSGTFVQDASAKNLYVYDIGSPLALEIHLSHFEMGKFLSYMLGNDLFSNSLDDFDRSRSDSESEMVAKVRDAWRAKLRKTQHGSYKDEDGELSEEELRQIAELGENQAEVGSRISFLDQQLAALDAEVERARSLNNTEESKQNSLALAEAEEKRKKMERELLELQDQRERLESSLQVASKVERVNEGWSVDERFVTPAREIPWEVPHQLKEAVSFEKDKTYTLREIAAEIAAQSRLNVRFERDVFDPEHYVRAAMPDIRNECNSCLVDSARLEIEGVRLQEALNIIAASFNVDWTFIDQYNSVVFYRHTVSHLPATVLDGMSQSELNLLRAELNSSRSSTGWVEIDPAGGVLLIDTPIRVRLLESIVKRK